MTAMEAYYIFSALFGARNVASGRGSCGASWM